MVTQEVKQEIFEAYNDRANTLRDLESTYGLPRAEITRIAVEMGATPRRPNAFGKRHGVRQVAKICPDCKKTVEVKGARFCCYCGADIRNKKAILCERIRGIITHIELLPAHLRDETRDVLLAAIEEITNNDRGE